MKLWKLSILTLVLAACDVPSRVEQTAKELITEAGDVFALGNEEAIDEAVMMDKLQVRGELTFIPNTVEPYSGLAKKVFDNDQLEFLFKFENGYISAIQSWRSNGSPQSYIEVSELAFDVGVWDSPWRDDSVLPSEAYTKTTGKLVDWYENLQIANVTLFTKEGQFDGKIGYFKNGQKSLQTEAKNGLVWNVKTWKPNGELVEEAVVNGDGDCTIYGEDGQIVSKSTFKNGGEQITYNAVAKDIDVVTLMDQLMSDNVENRLNALVELSDGRENAAPAMDLVLKLLQDDKEAKVREMATYVLMNMGVTAGKIALPMLKEALEKERNPTVKMNILSTISAIDPDSSPASSTPRQP